MTVLYLNIITNQIHFGNRMFDMYRLRHLLHQSMNISDFNWFSFVFNSMLISWGQSFCFLNLKFKVVHFTIQWTAINVQSVHLLTFWIINTFLCEFGFFNVRRTQNSRKYIHCWNCFTVYNIKFANATGHGIESCCLLPKHQFKSLKYVPSGTPYL